MKSFIEKMKKLEKFTQKLFSSADWEECTRKEIKINNYLYIPDYVFRAQNESIIVEVKNSLDLDSQKIKVYINEFQELKKQGFKIILVVYNNVIKYRMDLFENVAIILDISNILYIIKDNIILKNELMGILDYSIENIELKEPKIDIQLKHNEEIEEENRISILNSIGTGKNCFKIYEKFCVDALKYLFLDTLDLWEEQNKTDDGLNIFDLICKIKNNIDDDFFVIIEKYFKSKYIIFEFKNYDEPISQYEICTTEKYLYKTALRKVSIIITRRGINNNGDKMVKCILRETGKLIIILDDDDLKNMIELKEKGENPSLVLTNKLDFLLTHLEK